MHLTRPQLLVLILVFIASVSAWGIVLKMFIDSSLEFKWSVFVWFFGASLVAAVVAGLFDFYSRSNKKRHATLNKNNIEINNPVWSRDNAK